MFTFDLSMPLLLLGVTLAALLLSKRVEPRLKTTFEERQFKVRDAILLVVLLAVTVSIIAFIPQMALIAVFLFSYCSLLFTFSYLFSNLSKQRAQLFFLCIGLSGLAVGIVALLKVYGSGLIMFYGGLAGLGLAAFAVIAVLYEQLKKTTGSRWYLAAFLPVLFLIIFFMFMYEPVPLWSLVFLDLFGVLFAVLITLYLASLFTWKVTFIFAALLTIMDTIMVLVTGFTVTASEAVLRLGLPVVIIVPTIPFIVTVEGVRYMSLGLGDFFFAGILGTQVLKKYGRKVALISAVTMALSFGVFEAWLLTTNFGPFPGTVMILVGWLPVATWKLLHDLKTKSNVEVASKT